jgi:dTDP-4-amino-4,6-dideoxygalactose transaminase
MGKGMKMRASTQVPALEGGDPVRTDFLVYGQPRISEEEIQAVAETLRSGWIGTGPRVQEFEQAFREYIGAEEAVAVSSCTAALHLSVLEAGVGPGDEVIVPAMTFCASANAVLHAGATPVFVDCDPDTFNVAPEAVAKAVSSRTRAILPVHFAGFPCDMPGLLEVAREADLTVVEDCAHCIEGTIDGKHAGTFGKFGAFSFYPTKNVTTIEGGMVTTWDREAADRIRTTRLHGLSRDAWKRFGQEGYRHYQATMLGFKYNMTDVQASIGLHQLRKIEERLVVRESIWRTYDEAFRPLPVALPSSPPDGVRHSRHIYSLLVDPERVRVSRDRILEAIQREGIGVGVHYIAVPLHRYYRERFGISGGAYPNAERISERTLSLPLTPYLEERDVSDVIAAVTKVLVYYSR